MVSGAAIEPGAVTRGQEPGARGCCPSELAVQWGHPPRGGAQTASVPWVGTQCKEPAAPCWGGHRQERSSLQIWAWAPAQGSRRCGCACRDGGALALSKVPTPGEATQGTPSAFWAPHTRRCEAMPSTMRRRRLGRAPAHPVLPPNQHMRRSRGFPGAVPRAHACRDPQRRVPTAYPLPPGSPEPQGQVAAGVAQWGAMHRRDTVAEDQGGSGARAGVNVGHLPMTRDTVTGRRAQASRQLVPHCTTQSPL